MIEARPHRLLFVCTGNICRSPMAEYLARSYAEERGWPVEVRSASLMGLNGNPAHTNAIKVCAEIDLDLTPHKAQPLSAELLEWADWVLVMELAHSRGARDMLPAKDDRILLLGSFCGKLEIDDPIGGWKRRFRKSRDEIGECVRNFMDRLPPPGANFGFQND